MLNITIKDNTLKEAAMQGMDNFLSAVSDAVGNSIDWNITTETMEQLNSSQITLLAYVIMREEIMEGGFVQLIHNGYGPFIFKNPFARILKDWGLVDLGKLISKAHKFYGKYRAKIEVEMSDEEFMALFEQCPEFDDCDDEFVMNESEFSAQMAYYVDEHLTDFVSVDQ